MVLGESETRAKVDRLLHTHGALDCPCASLQPNKQWSVKQSVIVSLHRAKNKIAECRMIQFSVLARSGVQPVYAIVRYRYIPATTGSGLLSQEQVMFCSLKLYSQRRSDVVTF